MNGRVYYKLTLALDEKPTLAQAGSLPKLLLTVCVSVWGGDYHLYCSKVVKIFLLGSIFMLDIQLHYAFS